MKFGFELEAFCLDKDKKPVLVPDKLPHDECGWLVEVRSEPNSDITRAMYLLKAECEKVDSLALKEGVTLEYTPLKEVPRDLKVKAARKYNKGLIRYQNLYGYETHRCSSKLATASLHVSITNEKAFHYQKPFSSSSNLQVEAKFTYPGFVDHAKLIVGLDNAFKAEISKAKRNLGFYEIKSDGRIEYRSLPNDVDLDKLTAILMRLFA